MPKNAKLKKIVVLSEPWCGPCQEQKPVLEELADKHGIPFEVVHYSKAKKRAHALLSAADPNFNPDDVAVPTLFGLASEKDEDLAWFAEGFHTLRQLERFFGLVPAKKPAAKTAASKAASSGRRAAPTKKKAS